MHQQEIREPDFGTGKKKLSIYLIGLLACIVLTLIAFAVVMTNIFNNFTTAIIILLAAVIQFLFQIVCFLRLNTQTEQSKNNMMAFIFTLVILVIIVIGSIWIMWNLNYNLMH